VSGSSDVTGSEVTGNGVTRNDCIGSDVTGHRAVAAGKMECHMGNSQMFPSRPRGVSEEKTQEKPGEKKGAGNMNICTNAHIF
jgi:hypothetical protein